MSEPLTPWSVVSAAVPPRDTTKAEVLRTCLALETFALDDPPREAICVLQDARFISDRTRRFWASLAAAGTSVSVLARDVVASVAPGVRTVQLDDGDVLVDMWAYLIRWPDGRARAMVAVDQPLPDDGGAVADLERPLRLTETDEPTVVDDAWACVRRLDPGF